jgi:PAS domain S-box-containing protein
MGREPVQAAEEPLIPTSRAPDDPGDGRFLSAVLENLSDALVACDADGTLTLFNPAARRLHGLPAQPVPPELWPQYYDLYAADGSTRLRAEDVPLRRALAGAVVRDEEMVVRPAGRPPRTLLASGQQLRDAEGRLQGAVVVMHDITELRAAEQLRTDQARLEQQRIAAEAGVARLQALNTAAVAVNREQTVDGVLQAITEQAAVVVGAAQAVTSLTRSEDWSQAITAVVMDDEYAAWTGYAEPPDGSGIYSLVCETNRALRLSQDELEAHPRWRGFGRHAADHPPMRGWLAAPLVRRDGRNLGLVQLSDKRAADGAAAEFDAADEALLVQLAQLASLALEKAVEYEREHEVAVELQRSLLPQSLPEVPGLSAHVLYAPGRGEPDLAVGGDFYDLFPAGDDVVALALGDVVGHGLRSASLMGQVRSALRGIAVQEHDPVRVVAALDRVVASLAEDAMATLAYATLHVPTGRLELVLAGHPPPMVLAAGGVARLEVAPGLPLGALPGHPYASAVVHLPPGATLLMYSDGLVEQRSRALGEGLAALERHLEASDRGLPDLCEHLLERLTGGANDDDVALLAVRRDAPA